MIKIIENYNEEEIILKITKDLKKATEKKRKIMVIVPEQFTLEAEKMLIEKLETLGLMDIYVTSIKRVSSKILSFFPVKATISPIGKTILLKNTLDILKEDLSFFAKVSNKENFLSNLIELFSELKKNNEGRLLFKEILENEEISPLSAEKISDLDKIFSLYNSFLGDDYIDSEEITLLAALKAEECDFLLEYDIFYYGFHTFDKNIYTLIEAFSKMEIKQNFYFVTKQGLEKRGLSCYDIVENTIHKIKEIGLKNNINTENIKLKNTILVKEDIFHLSNNLYTYESIDGVENSSNIFIYENESIYDEVEAVALSILDVVKNKEARYKNILVVASDYENYKDIIASSFKRHNIPFFLDMKTKIASTNIVTAFINTLEIIRDNFATHDIIAYLKNMTTSLTKQEISLLENYTKAFDIKGYMWLKDFTKQNTKYNFDLTLLNALRTKVIGPLLSLSEKIKKEKDPKVVTREIYLFLEKENFSGIIQGYVDKYKSEKRYDIAGKYAQIYNYIIEVLEQSHEYIKDTNISLNKYIDILKAAFSSIEVGVIPSSIDSVNIASLNRSRSYDISYLFLLGFNEELIPKAVKDDGIFLESEKALLSSSGVNIKSSKDYKLKEEKYLLNYLISKTKEEIYISYGKNNLSYEPLMPSPLIDTIKDILNIQIENPYFSKDLNFFLSTNIATFKYLCKFYNHKGIEYIKHKDFFKKVLEIYEEDEHNNDLINSLYMGLNFDNSAKIKNKKLLTHIYDNSIKTSANGIKTYYSCPFSYFLKYILHLKENLTPKVSSMDLGNILHTVINKMSTLILEESIDIEKITKEEIFTLNKTLCDEVINEYSFGLLKEKENHSFIYFTIINHSNFALNRIIDSLKNSKFKLSSSEEHFIKEISKEEKLGVSLNGVIDRVDSLNIEDKKYFRIIDYKSSNTAFDATKTYYGLDIQLPSYILAKENKDFFVAGAFFFPLKKPCISIKNNKALTTLDKDLIKEKKINGLSNSKEEIQKEGKNINSTTKHLSSSQFNSLCDFTRDKISTACDNILKGDIKINPYLNGSVTPCEYCNYKGICKFSTDFKGSKYNFVKRKSLEDIIGAEDENEAN